MIAQKYLDNAGTIEDIRWFQYGILHGGIENCRSTEYPSIFNLVDNPVNLRWIKRHAFNELIGRYTVKKMIRYLKNIHWTLNCFGFLPVAFYESFVG